MIIVSQSDADSNAAESPPEKEGEAERSQSTKSLIKTTVAQLTTTTSLSTTTADIPSTPTTSSTATTPTSTESAELLTTTAFTTASTTDPMANFMLFLKQTAPVLPYIPVLVRSLQSVDTRSGDVSLAQSLPYMPSGNQAFGVPVHSPQTPAVTASHFYNTDPVVASPPHSELSLVELARKFGLLGEEDLLTTVSPPEFATATEAAVLDSLRNVFGMAMTTERPELMPTLYPPKLISADSRRRSPTSKTTPERVTKSREELEKLHSELFKRKQNEHSFTTTTATAVTTTTPNLMSNELVVFKKPTRVESEVATKLTELTKFLPNGATDDLKMLREIPDIEGLTRGMDLTLISKPGGFAKLKKQFVERLMRRTIGLPVVEPSNSLLPPIKPIRVTHKMMRERARKLAKRIRKSRA